MEYRSNWDKEAIELLLRYAGTTGGEWSDCLYRHPELSLPRAKDATLIASAPQMQEALKKLIESTEKFAEAPSEKVSDYWTALLDAVEKAKQLV